MAQTTQTQSQSAAIMQREIYSVTRSEATWLVETYMNAKKKGADGGMEPYRVFRDELETAKPAYLGKFNNSSNAAVQGTFYQIATNLYKMLNELNRRVSDTNHHKKTMDAAKLLPCKHSLAYLTGTFLNWAVYNWHMKTSYPIAEDLGDNGYEKNTCVVCDFTGYALFYYSTTYGLEKPVCGHCVPFDADDFKEEGEYVLSDEEASEEEASDEEADASEDEADASACETDDDEEEYKPSLESEAEQDEDELDDEYTDDDASETDTDDVYLPTLSDANVTVRVHQRFETPSPSASDSASASDSSSSDSSSSDSSSDSESDDDSEKSFGCSGCKYEFKQGWKTGYKAAMKEMCNYADDQKNDVPDVPSCAACGDSHECLKKCGRCKMVRYCTEDCQTKDWPEHKRVCRR